MPSQLNPASVMSPVENFASLKCLLFIFFGGIGCLVPGLALAGRAVGLHTDELAVISVVAPCIALLGPLVAAPLADRLGTPAQGSADRYGRYMRTLLVFATIIGAVLYTALLFVPQVSRRHERNPAVVFACDQEGAIVMQDQCQEIPCYDWPDDNRGTLFLSGCRYVCGDEPISPEALFNTPPPRNESSEDGGNEQEKTLEEDDGVGLTTGMPQLCFDQNGQSVCHVYTINSRQLPINVTLSTSPTPASREEWCTYKILDNLMCKQPSIYAVPRAENQNCSVVCDLDNPYNSSNSHSLLLESECRNTLGDPELTFWSFLLLRSAADIFPTMAVALLASCLIVAARDTPAILCRQLVYAVLGYTVSPPIVEFVAHFLPDPIFDKKSDIYGFNMIAFAFLSLISALILLFSRSLPLSPVDYHLHSGPGMLTLRGAGGEIGALSLVLVLLGLLSFAIDSYIPWESVVLALIPSLLVLWFSEKVVDYCGHSNILIISFTLYIIRYTGLLVFKDVMVLFLFGALEVFTLILSWSTALLYLRHLVPRHFLVSGQALAIVAFFCIGRCLGSLIGGLLMEHVKDSPAPKWNDYPSETLYKIGAVLAAIIASLYFVLYHFCLKHKWRKQNSRVSRPVAQDTNANGTYTPLKIYNQPSKDQRIRY